jgi:Cof subfamily protein (haloacid dehalogenase superfamily)
METPSSNAQPEPARAGESPLRLNTTSENPNHRSKIDLLALDLDGTILGDQFTISARVLDALSEAERRGVRVTIATGRPVEVTRPFVQAVRVNAPAICLQGGLIYDFTTEKVLHELTLPHELGCTLADLERQHPAWQAVVYAGDALYISSIRYDQGFYASLLGKSLAVRTNLCEALGGQNPQKVLFIVPAEDAPLALNVLKGVAGECATVVQSHALFVEVNPSGADKGAGLARLAEDLGIPRERVMAIGDQDNDATMIAWAGLGVAMGNASAASKAVADWVAPPVNEDGAAVAIERFVFGREARGYRAPHTSM